MTDIGNHAEIMLGARPPQSIGRLFDLSGFAATFRFTGRQHAIFDLQPPVTSYTASASLDPDTFAATFDWDDERSSWMATFHHPPGPVSSAIDLISSSGPQRRFRISDLALEAHFLAVFTALLSVLMRRAESWCKSLDLDVSPHALIDTSLETLDDNPARDRLLGTAHSFSDLKPDLALFHHQRLQSPPSKHRWSDVLFVGECKLSADDSTELQLFKYMAAALSSCPGFASMYGMTFDKSTLELYRVDSDGIEHITKLDLNRSPAVLVDLSFLLLGLCVRQSSYNSLRHRLDLTSLRHMYLSTALDCNSTSQTTSPYTSIAFRCEHVSSVSVSEDEESKGKDTGDKGDGDKDHCKTAKGKEHEEAERHKASKEVKEHQEHQPAKNDETDKDRGGKRKGTRKRKRTKKHAKRSGRRKGDISNNSSEDGKEKPPESDPATPTPWIYWHSGRLVHPYTCVATIAVRTMDQEGAPSWTPALLKVSHRSEGDTHVEGNVLKTLSNLVQNGQRFDGTKLDAIGHAAAQHYGRAIPLLLAHGVLFVSQEDCNLVLGVKRRPPSELQAPRLCSVRGLLCDAANNLVTTATAQGRKPVAVITKCQGSQLSMAISACPISMLPTVIADVIGVLHHVCRPAGVVHGDISLNNIRYFHPSEEQIWQLLNAELPSQDRPPMGQLIDFADSILEHAPGAASAPRRYTSGTRASWSPQAYQNELTRRLINMLESLGPHDTGAKEMIELERAKLRPLGVDDDIHSCIRVLMFEFIARLDLARYQDNGRGSRHSFLDDWGRTSEWLHAVGDTEQRHHYAYFMFSDPRQTAGFRAAAASKGGKTNQASDVPADLLAGEDDVVAKVLQVTRDAIVECLELCSSRTLSAADAAAAAAAAAAAGSKQRKIEDNDNDNDDEKSEPDVAASQSSHVVDPRPSAAAGQEQGKPSVHVDVEGLQKVLRRLTAALLRFEIFEHFAIDIEVAKAVNP